MLIFVVFPEMRAQLRTYHSIPCLQVHQDSNSQYKGLQDAPRLKSILKGSCEDPNQPTTIEAIQSAPVPRTNPVNLIFVMSQYAPKVSETHFFQPRDFFDLVIRGTWSSKSRATAFLWLMWWYLESDFSEKDALNNPFGKGLYPDDADSLPLKVPKFDCLTEEQANEENVDTDEEKAYGERMAVVRKKILEEDETVGPPVKKPAGRKLCSPPNPFIYLYILTQPLQDSGILWMTELAHRQLDLKMAALDLRHRLHFHLSRCQSLKGLQLHASRMVWSGLMWRVLAEHPHASF